MSEDSQQIYTDMPQFFYNSAEEQEFIKKTETDIYNGLNFIISCVLGSQNIDPKYNFVKTSKIFQEWLNTIITPNNKLFSDTNSPEIEYPNPDNTDQLLKLPQSDKYIEKNLITSLYTLSRNIDEYAHAHR